MNAVILKQEEYNELINSIKEIKSKILEKPKSISDEFIENEGFLELMKISRRTAQTWRDEGIISFSQQGKKIYYRNSDIKKFLDANYNKAFNSKRR
ncbi:helix-turn-helix domain-containing protein [Lutibacter sp.]|uniref:helix-turn-helix domain-containing protein n=1 Tax=Lutibacter sp. TaxID=1925666 RepID=UPI00356901FD